VPLTAWDAEAGTVSYSDPETGESISLPVSGGHCKLQWKADWAMRWVALGVDYEMAGKDLIDSVKLSGRIARILGANPPEGFNYELFLDEKGEKISKSKGNGLTIEEWLRYASPESLSLFMFQQPRRAKRLYFDVIPRAVEDYYAFRRNFPDEEHEKRVENPSWHVHSGPPPADAPPVSFSMLLNLVSASNSEDREILWGFIRNYAPGTTPETAPELDRLVDYAIAYFHDFVKPAKSFRAPDARERKALMELDDAFAALPADSDGETIQNEVYRIGRDNGFEPLRDWFKAIYQVLFGQDQGPRFGSFVAIYGIEPTRNMIARALDAETAS
ncbi:MAG: lysine--tRNA ligase, partial [Pseudomonadota bacterium]